VTSHVKKDAMQVRGKKKNNMSKTATKNIIFGAIGLFAFKNQQKNGLSEMKIRAKQN